MRDTRNARVLAVASIAEHITAALVTQAVQQLDAERARALDGPDVGDSAGRSTNATSTTERNASEAYRLGLLKEDLRDAIHGLEIAHTHLRELAQQAVRTRAFGAVPETPPELPVCKHGQHAKVGAIIWGDPTCDMAAVKMELCAAHYAKYYRYRKDHGLAVVKDFAKAKEIAS